MATPRKRPVVVSKIPAPRRDNGFRYRAQYGVIAICRDEAEQARLYRRLCGEGLTVKVVTT